MDALAGLLLGFRQWILLALFEALNSPHHSFRKECTGANLHSQDVKVYHERFHTANRKVSCGAKLPKTTLYPKANAIGPQ